MFALSKDEWIFFFPPMQQSLTTQVLVNFKTHAISCSDENVMLILKEYRKNLENLVRNGDAELFYRDLCELVQNHQIRKRDKKDQTLDNKSFEYYERVIQDIHQVGWQNLEYAAENLHQLRFQIEDEKGRRHLLNLTLPHSYPGSVLVSSQPPPVCVCETPAPFDLYWNQQGKTTHVNNKLVKGSSLLDIVDQFKTHLQKFQKLWDVLDDFDSQCLVLEPNPLPCRASNSRRIIIGRHQSIHIKIPIENPFSLCEVLFLGAETEIMIYRNAFATNSHLWDYAKTPRRNLETILGISFPTREESKSNKKKKQKKEISSSSDDQDDDFGMNCAICYSYRLKSGLAIASTTSASVVENHDTTSMMMTQDQLPDIVCENPKCARAFHPACLIEWLRSIPTTRTSFSSLFGACPFCSESISVSTLKTANSSSSSSS